MPYLKEMTPEERNAIEFVVLKDQYYADGVSAEMKRKGRPKKRASEEDALNTQGAREKYETLDWSKIDRDQRKIYEAIIIRELCLGENAHILKALTQMIELEVERARNTDKEKVLPDFTTRNIHKDHRAQVKQFLVKWGLADEGERKVLRLMPRGLEIGKATVAHKENAERKILIDDQRKAFSKALGKLMRSTEKSWRTQKEGPKPPFSVVQETLTAWQERKVRIPPQEITKTLLDSCRSEIEFLLNELQENAAGPDSEKETEREPTLEDLLPGQQRNRRALKLN